MLLRAAGDSGKGGDVTHSPATAATDDAQDEAIARLQTRAQAAIEAAGRYAGHEALAAHLRAFQPLLLATSTVLLLRKRSDLAHLAAQCSEAAAAAAATAAEVEVQSNLPEPTSEMAEAL
jgi:hypothetical protein